MLSSEAGRVGPAYHAPSKSGKNLLYVHSANGKGHGDAWLSFCGFVCRHHQCMRVFLFVRPYRHTKRAFSPQQITFATASASLSSRVRK